MHARRNQQKTRQKSRIRARAALALGCALLLCGAGVACRKKDERATTAPTTTAATTAAPHTSAPGAPGAVLPSGHPQLGSAAAHAPPAGAVLGTPTEPVFTPDYALKLIDDLAACPSADRCPAAGILAGFGTKVSAELANVATERGRPVPVRRLALHVLGRIADPAAHAALRAAARTEPNAELRAELLRVGGGAPPAPAPSAR